MGIGSKALLDRVHAVRKIVNCLADLPEQTEKFGDRRGFTGSGSTEDVCTFALAGNDDAFGNEFANGVPSGHDRYFVPGGQLSECRQLVAGAVGSRADRLA